MGRNQLIHVGQKEKKLTRFLCAFYYQVVNHNTHVAVSTGNDERRML
jgi:hypothetical protein